MSVNNSTTKWVRLGDYIKRSMANNNNLKYGIELIEGVNSKGEFCTTKAALEGINLKPYKIVKNGDFVYNPSRLNIGSLAYRQSGMCIVSHLYVVFRLNDIGEKLIVPEFLYLFFNRDEFLRLITYLNFGSQRPEFNFYDMSEIQIPLPNPVIQQELVDTYNGLKALAEQNEALSKPLNEACQAYIVDCKKKYSEVELGEYIEVLDVKNVDSYDFPFCGINKDKTFMPTVADTNELDSSKYKIVKKDVFVFSGMQTGRDVCIRLALYKKSGSILVSPAYTTFVVKDKSEIFPQYLFIQFNRFEMDRYGWFLSDGSIRSNLDWSEFCSIRIPIPPFEVQKAIVDIYNCSEEAKKIATEAREKMKMLCPALIQRAING